MELPSPLALAWAGNAFIAGFCAWKLLFAPWIERRRAQRAERAPA